MKRTFQTLITCGMMICLPFVVQAHPDRFEGNYRFQGNIEPQGRLTVDVIDTRMPDAAQRLKEMRAQGANCEQKTSTVIRCSKMRDASAVAPLSLRQIAEHNAGFFVSFGGESALPALISEGASLSEWKMSQAGEWNGDRFDSYRYLLLRGSQGELAKLILNGAQTSLELFTQDGLVLGKTDSVSITESRWRWHIDFATVVLEK